MLSEGTLVEIVKTGQRATVYAAPMRNGILTVEKDDGDLETLHKKQVRPVQD